MSVALGLKERGKGVAALGPQARGCCLWDDYPNGPVLEIFLHWQDAIVPEKQFHLPRIYVVKF